MITEDRQKDILHEWQGRFCKPVSDETLPLEASRSILEALWDRRFGLPLDAPSLSTEDRSNHFYDVSRHSIRMGARPSSVPTMHLLHEIAHAVIGAMGIGLVTAKHGPLFCYEYGKLWSAYTTKDFSVWERRCNRSGLFVAQKWPDLEGYDWALVEENGSRYAMRPAKKAEELELDVAHTFADIKNHPLSA